MKKDENDVKQNSDFFDPTTDIPGPILVGLAILSLPFLPLLAVLSLINSPKALIDSCKARKAEFENELRKAHDLANKTWKVVEVLPYNAWFCAKSGKSFVKETRREFVLQNVANPEDVAPLWIFRDHPDYFNYQGLVPGQTLRFRLKENPKIADPVSLLLIPEFL